MSSVPVASLADLHNVRFSNAIGVWTLYSREVRRFIKVYTQTIAAPIATTLLFLAVFTLALGRAVETIKGVPLIQFLVPGLIMMAITQNSFANTSSSLMISKVQGNIVDSLMPSLTAHELTLGIALGGATRGVVVGLAVALVMALFTPLSVHSWTLVLFHGFLGGLLMSLLGMIGGIWADKFDHIAAVTNFIVTPLAFLSGTFYSIERLPPIAQVIAHFNPFFYLIDGFRYGFIGQSDSSLWLGVVVISLSCALLWLAAWRMLDSGYKLKP